MPEPILDITDRKDFRSGQLREQVVDGRHGVMLLLECKIQRLGVDTDAYLSVCFFLTTARADIQSDGSSTGAMILADSSHLSSAMSCSFIAIGILRTGSCTGLTSELISRCIVPGMHPKCPSKTSGCCPTNSFAVRWCSHSSSVIFMMFS